MTQYSGPAFASQFALDAASAAGPAVTPVSSLTELDSAVPPRWIKVAFALPAGVVPAPNTAYSHAAVLNMQNAFALPASPLRQGVAGRYVDAAGPFTVAVESTVGAAPPSSPSSNAMPPGQILGFVVLGLVVLIAAVAVAVFVAKRRNVRHPSRWSSSRRGVLSSGAAAVDTKSVTDAGATAPVVMPGGASRSSIRGLGLGAAASPSEDPHLVNPMAYAMAYQAPSTRRVAAPPMRAST